MISTPLPAAWFDVEPLVGDDSDVRELLRNPKHPLIDVVRCTPPEQGRVLAAGVRSSLGAHATFSYPAEHGAIHAAALLAAWIGPEPESVHEDLGGTVTIVRSGLGHRDDQQWHTDSTPWWRPNPMTLLGQIHLAEGQKAPATELLPLSAVDAAMVNYPSELATLRSNGVPWRRNFPDRRQFAAPILSFDPPRWVSSVLDDLAPDLPANLAAAVDTFRNAIADLPAVRSIVEPGQLLIFDNRANLHRGPKIEQDLERRLIRIKLGGTPE